MVCIGNCKKLLEVVRVKTKIYPHPFLLYAGRAYALLSYGCSAFLVYGAIFDCEETHIIMLGCAEGLAVFIIQYVIFQEHLFSTLLITDDYIKYYGLFLPSVKIKFDDIKYMEIRTFKEGNVVYGQNPVIGAYQFILLSTSPLPSKRIDKIHSSKKRKLIKFAISEKLCRALEGKLPGMLNKPIEYQLFLYKRAKK